MNKRRQRAALTGLRSAHNGQHGFTLTEVLIALSIIAAVAVVFLLGMTTSSKSVMVSQESISAESLAKSELEYVKSVSYVDATWSYELPSNPPSWAPTRSLPSGYDGYSVQVNAAPAPSHTTDDGLQRITVTVTHDGEPVFNIVGYKVKP